MGHVDVMGLVIRAKNDWQDGWERMPNGHNFNILHMEGRAGELKHAGITQNEMKSGERYSK